MLQYISTIHHAASKYTWENVAYYDNVFRHWMAKNRNRSWGKTFGQMWNLALCDPLSVAKNNSTSSWNKGGKDQKGICWRFNKGICKGPCRYIHRCTFCGGTNHGSHACYKKNRKSDQNRPQNSSNNVHPPSTNTNNSNGNEAKPTSKPAGNQN